MNRSRSPLARKLQDDGLQILDVNVNGGVNGDSATITFNNYVKIYSLVSTTNSYLLFPEITKAAASNSIINSVVVTGAALAPINGLLQVYLPNTFYMFPEPLVVSVIVCTRITGNAGFRFWYKNYTP